MGSQPRRSGTQRCLVTENNNYLGCSSFYPGDDGSFKARKAQFAACHFLMLDDLGTKVPLDRLDGFELSWLIETSPGNYQGGIILDAPITDGAVAVRLLNAVIDAGLCDAGATGPLSRWARLPVAINGKPKYADDAGAPFQCRLIEWRPDKPLLATGDCGSAAIGTRPGREAEENRRNLLRPTLPPTALAMTRTTF